MSFSGFNWGYLLWIPATLVYNFIASWVAVRYNDAGFLKMYLGMFLIGLIPNWALAAYFSRNLILDCFLYETVLILSSPLFLAALGQASKFGWINWLGLWIAIAGLVLVGLPHR